MKSFFKYGLALILFSMGFASTTLAKFIVKDANGNEIEIKPMETPLRKFQKTYSFDEYQKLDQIDRQFALYEALVASLDPEAKVNSEQKRNIQYVLAQHFETLPEDAKSKLIEKTLWMSVLGDNRELTLNLVKKYVPPYSEERTKALCKIATNIASMVTYSKNVPSAENFLKLPDKTLQLFSSMVTTGTSVTGEKCKFNPDDKEGMSLLELNQEISKKLSKNKRVLTAAPAGTQSDPNSKKPCQISEIENAFKDAIERIDRAGPKMQVMIGLGNMTCPFNGLVTKDPKGKYRFYPNSHRDDSVAPITFGSAKEVVGLFKIVPTVPTNTVPKSSFGTTAPGAL
jgi:hypothetical protein